MSQSAVSRIWRAFGLQPHQQPTGAMEAQQGSAVHRQGHDVVGLYLDPREGAEVLCVDENNQLQALDRTALIFSMMPGTPARR